MVEISAKRKLQCAVLLRHTHALMLLVRFIHVPMLHVYLFISRIWTYVVDFLEASERAIFHGSIFSLLLYKKKHLRLNQVNMYIG